MLGLSPRIVGMQIGVFCRMGGDAWGLGVNEGFRAAGDLVPSCFTGESGVWSVRGGESDSVLAMSFHFLFLL